jgi:hypothetical protein
MDLNLLTEENDGSERGKRLFPGDCFDRNVPVPPKQDRRVKSIRPDHGGHKMNETSFARILLATVCPGSPALWAESFTS